MSFHCTNNKNPISATFNPNSFQLYMTVGAHFWYADLKWQLSQPTMCEEYHRQNAPIAYYIRTFIENNLIAISMNTDPSKLSPYMDINITRRYKYF